MLLSCVIQLSPSLCFIKIKLSFMIIRRAECYNIFVEQDNDLNTRQARMSTIKLKPNSNKTHQLFTSCCKFLLYSVKCPCIGYASFDRSRIFPRSHSCWIVVQICSKWQPTKPVYLFVLLYWNIYNLVIYKQSDLMYSKLLSLRKVLRYVPLWLTFKM